MKKNNRHSGFLCFGGEDWWYHNRGHIDFQLMRRFAQKIPVLYINSIVMQKPRLGKDFNLLNKVIRKTKSIFTGLKHIENNFWVYSPVSLPAQHIPGLQGLNEFFLKAQIYQALQKLDINDPVLWIACPSAYPVTLRIPHCAYVYQRTDRHEDTPDVNRDLIMEYDRAMRKRADLTIYVNTKMYDQEQSTCKRPYFLDHGVDYEMFTAADHDAFKPEDIASIPKPIIGYFGGIADHKIDKEFIRQIARRLPNYSFVFVGAPSPGFLTLVNEPNIYLLGQKPYEQIPHYGICYDTAILPWRKNCWTEAANPIKLKEYFALGKPVVCTSAFSEAQEYQELLYCADTVDDFVQQIQRALQENSQEKILQRREWVRNLSWDSKASLILKELGFSNL